MALITKDRVEETSTTTGTGTFTLSGVVTGYQSFSAIGNGNTTYYTITLQGGSEWEVGIGTYTSSGTTLSRDTILASSNSGNLVNFSAGTKNVFVVFPAATSTSDVQQFTTVGSSTWTKPAGAKVVEAILIGGGGGGGSGRKGLTSTARSGGNGGGGGAYSVALFNATDLAATVTVTVGAGGTGGAAQTTGTTNGNAGTRGGASSFGAYLYAVGGNQGLGGATSGPAAPQTPIAGTRGNGALGASSTASTVGIAGNFPDFSGAGCGGANGGPITSSNVVVAGGQGCNTTNSTAPSWINGNTASPANSSVTGNGASGTDLPSTSWFGGESGDGGGASTTAAGNGGNGGKWGGGGGGGGAVLNGAGNTSGAGGNGGDGLAVVITYF